MIYSIIYIVWVYYEWVAWLWVYLCTIWYNLSVWHDSVRTYKMYLFEYGISVTVTLPNNPKKSIAMIIKMFLIDWLVNGILCHRCYVMFLSSTLLFIFSGIRFLSSTLLFIFSGIRFLPNNPKNHMSCASGGDVGLVGRFYCLVMWSIRFFISQVSLFLV